MKKKKDSFNKIIKTKSSNIEIMNNLKINRENSYNRKIQTKIKNTENNCDNLSIYTLEKKIFKKLANKYRQSRNVFNIMKINKLLYGAKSHMVAEFKDSIIFFENEEFIHEFYPMKTAIKNLSTLLYFYGKYSCIYPNYVILSQSKYLYENLSKKQKLINTILKLKNQHSNREDSIQIFDTNIINNILNQTNTSNINKILGIDLNIEREENSSIIKDINTILNKINIAESERVSNSKKKSRKKTHERCSTNGNNYNNNKFFRDTCLKIFNNKNNNKIKDNANYKSKNKKTKKRNNRINHKKINIKEINLKCIQNLSGLDVCSEKTNRKVSQFFYSVFSTKENLTKNLKSSPTENNYNNSVKKRGKHSLSLSHNKKQINKQNNQLKIYYYDSPKICRKYNLKSKNNSAKNEKLIIIKKSQKNSKNGKNNNNFQKYSKDKKNNISLYENDNINKKYKKFQNCLTYYNNKIISNKDNVQKSILNKLKGILNLNTYKIHAINNKKIGITPMTTCTSTWSAASYGKVSGKGIEIDNMKNKKSKKNGTQFYPQYDLLYFDSNMIDSKKNKCLNNIRCISSMNSNQNNYIKKQNNILLSPTNNFGNSKNYKGVLYEKNKKLENNVALTENNIIRGMNVKFYRSPLTTRTSQNTSTKNIKKKLKESFFVYDTKNENNKQKILTNKNCNYLSSIRIVKNNTTNKNNYYITSSPNIYGRFKRNNLRKISNN